MEEPKPRPSPSRRRPNDEHPHTIARNARLGLWLFAVYVIIYAGFVALSAFSPKLMARDVAGVNLAIVYGFGLIIAAFVLAIIYMFLTGRANAGENIAGENFGGEDRA